MSRIYSFAPIIDAGTKVLIVGTIPGAESLRQQQYYANKHNHFWRVMASVLGLDPGASYDERVRALLQKRVGVWDIFQSCYREGSLDTNIKEGLINDFIGLFKQYPDIRYVVFNGGKAHDTFKSKVGFKHFPGVTFVRMPSTSPAHTIPFTRKLEKWADLHSFLDD